MATSFPMNTVVWILATMIASGSGAWLVLSRGLQRLPLDGHVRSKWRWGAGLVLIAWLGLRLALAVYPPAGTGLGFQFTITFALLGVGLLAGILPLLVSPVFRQLVQAVPPTWLVGIHAIRIAGFLFLALLDMQLLPAEFALSAGYGDITVGLLALGMVALLANRKSSARALGIGWNALGLLDFVSALAIGGLTLLPFARQAAASGVSLQYLNYMLIVPGFGVGLYTLVHIYSLVQMFSRRAGAAEQAQEEPAGRPVFQR